jgi:hypothetical protein
MTPGVNRLRNLTFFCPCPGADGIQAVSGNLLYPYENHFTRRQIPRMVYTSKRRPHLTFIFDALRMPTPPRESAVPSLRWDLVVRVRQEIQAGTYETNEKWEIALSRLQDDLERRAAIDDEEVTW